MQPTNNGSDNFTPRVRELEEKLSQARAQIQSLKEESSLYRKAFLKAAGDLCTPKDWEDFDPSDYNLTWEQVLAEAERPYKHA